MEKEPIMECAVLLEKLKRALARNTGRTIRWDPWTGLHLRHRTLVLECRDRVREEVERNMSLYKGLIWPVMTRLGANRLVYLTERISLWAYEDARDERDHVHKVVAASLVGKTIAQEASRPLYHDVYDIEVRLEDTMLVFSVRTETEQGEPEVLIDDGMGHSQWVRPASLHIASVEPVGAYSLVDEDEPCEFPSWLDCSRLKDIMRQYQDYYAGVAEAYSE